MSIGKEFPYLYRGIVLDNLDSKNLGRCKVKIPSIHGNSDITSNLLPWARYFNPNICSTSRGSYNIPDIGDVVWIFFEGGNKEYPVYIGGTISTKDIPVDLNKVLIYQEDDNSLVYDRVNKEFILKTSGSEIKVKDNKVSIVGSESLDITSPTINLKGNVNIEGITTFNNSVVGCPHEHTH